VTTKVCGNVSPLSLEALEFGRARKPKPGLAEKRQAFNQRHGKLKNEENVLERNLPSKVSKTGARATVNRAIPPTTGGTPRRCSAAG
jgi:hypothetical protein